MEEADSLHPGVGQVFVCWREGVAQEWCMHTYRKDGERSRQSLASRRALCGGALVRKEGSWEN